MDNSIFQEKNIAKAYFKLSIPLVFSMVVTLIYNLADTFFVAQTGDTIPPTTDYYTYLAIGAPVIMVSFVHSNLLRSEGKSTESMIGTVGGAIINIILDPIFISVLGMGTEGAAIASVIGYICTDIYYALVVIKKSEILSLQISEFRVPVSFVRRILTVGTPAAIVNIMQSVCIVLVNQFLLPYGNDKIAAMGIAIKINLIALLILTGFAFGGAPLFGYYYGARNREQLTKLLKFCLRFILGTAVLLTVLLFASSSLLMNIFTTNRGIAADGAQMLRLQVIMTPCVGLILLLTIVFQSFGKSTGSFLLSISRQGVIFVAVLMIASRLIGYKGILVSQAVSDLLSAILAVVLFKVLLQKEFDL